jgi:hypothetical protein
MSRALSLRLGRWLIHHIQDFDKLHGLYLNAKGIH